MQSPRKKVAESLIETIIAITIVSFASAGAMALIRTSVFGNNIVGSKIVAINLAAEGVEAVKNIIDTNNLRFASDKTNCWNTINVTDVSQCSDPGKKITVGVTYYLMQDLTTDLFTWNLVPTDATNNGELTLYGVDTDGVGGADSQYYAQPGLVAGYLTELESGKYSRVLNFKYEGNILQINSTVSWVTNNVSKSVLFTSYWSL